MLHLKGEAEAAEAPRGALARHHVRVRLAEHGDEQVEQDHCSEDHVDDVDHLHPPARPTHLRVVGVKGAVRFQPAHTHEQVEGEEEGVPPRGVRLDTPRGEVEKGVQRKAEREQHEDVDEEEARHVAHDDVLHHDRERVDRLEAHREGDRVEPADDEGEAEQVDLRLTAGGARPEPRDERHAKHPARHVRQVEHEESERQVKEGAQPPPDTPPATLPAANTLTRHGRHAPLSGERLVEGEGHMVELEGEDEERPREEGRLDARVAEGAPPRQVGHVVGAEETHVGEVCRHQQPEDPLVGGPVVSDELADGDDVEHVGSEHLVVHRRDDVQARRCRLRVPGARHRHHVGDVEDVRVAAPRAGREAVDAGEGEDGGEDGDGPEAGGERDDGEAVDGGVQLGGEVDDGPPAVLAVQVRVLVGTTQLAVRAPP